MNILNSITLLLTISCCLWTTEGIRYKGWDRKYNSVLTVPNGGPWGRWGEIDLCPVGFAKGFQLKVAPEQKEGDDTGLDGILLLCSDPKKVTSTRSPWGSWNDPQYCPTGALVAFSLRVLQYQGTGDDTAATNIQFKCSDGTILMGQGMDWGEFGEWSPNCPQGSTICGIQTKFEGNQWSGDDTTLNDVKFFCCSA